MTVSLHPFTCLRSTISMFHTNNQTSSLSPEPPPAPLQPKQQEEYPTNGRPVLGRRRLRFGSLPRCISDMPAVPDSPSINSAAQTRKIGVSRLLEGGPVHGGREDLRSNLLLSSRLFAVILRARIFVLAQLSLTRLVLYEFCATPVHCCDQTLLIIVTCGSR